MPKKISKKITPKRAGDMPVTMRLLDLRTQELNGNITTLRLEMKAGFSKIESQITRMMVMFEEQNARNKVALDGYTIVYEKLEECDARLEKIEKHLSII